MNIVRNHRTSHWVTYILFSKYIVRVAPSWFIPKLNLCEWIILNDEISFILSNYIAESFLNRVLFIWVWTLGSIYSDIHFENCFELWKRYYFSHFSISSETKILIFLSIHHASIKSSYGSQCIFSYNIEVSSVDNLSNHLSILSIVDLFPYIETHQFSLTRRFTSCLVIIYFGGKHFFKSERSGNSRVLKTADSISARFHESFSSIAIFII